MRVSEERYSRDLRRLELAVRLVRHEARTSTICAWTGLSVGRVRAIYRSALTGSGVAPIPRHRGPVPKDVTVLLRSVALRSEAAAAAVLCQGLGVIPLESGPAALKVLPSVARGERLCLAFETYRAQVLHARLSLEHVLLLVNALTAGIEVGLGFCGACGASILIDRLSAARRTCAMCQAERASSPQPLGVADALPAIGPATSMAEPLVHQHSLF